MSWFEDREYIKKLKEYKESGSIDNETADYAIKAIEERLELVVELSKLRYPNFENWGNRK